VRREDGLAVPMPTLPPVKKESPPVVPVKCSNAEEVAELPRLKAAVVLVGEMLPSVVMKGPERSEEVSTQVGAPVPVDSRIVPALPVAV